MAGMQRAIRRHHKERMKAKARRIARAVWTDPANRILQQQVIEAASRRADHLKSCGCEMCRNPRRSTLVGRAERRTRQEIKAKFTDM